MWKNGKEGRERERKEGEAGGREAKRKEREGERKKGRREGEHQQVSGETFFPEIQSFGANPWACRVARRILFTIIEVCLCTLGITLEWLSENTFLSNKRHVLCPAVGAAATKPRK